jgi:hypothetical protein
VLFRRAVFTHFTSVIYVPARPGVPETGISGWPRLVVNQKKAKFS